MNKTLSKKVECKHLNKTQLLSSSENERWVCEDCDELVPAPDNPDVKSEKVENWDYKVPLEGIFDKDSLYYPLVCKLVDKALSAHNKQLESDYVQWKSSGAWDEAEIAQEEWNDFQQYRKVKQSLQAKELLGEK